MDILASTNENSVKVKGLYTCVGHLYYDLFVLFYVIYVQSFIAMLILLETIRGFIVSRNCHINMGISFRNSKAKGIGSSGMVLHIPKLFS